MIRVKESSGIHEAPRRVGFGVFGRGPDIDDHERLKSGAPGPRGAKEEMLVVPAAA